MAEWLVGKVVDKFINFCFEYLQNKLTWQTGMKDKLERLRDNHHKITTFLSAARRAQIIDQDTALNKWIWKLRDAIDEADDLIDDFEYLKLKEQVDKNKEENKVRYISNILSNPAKRLRIGGEDPLNLKRLEEVVQKLDVILAEATPFLHLLEDEKQKQGEQLVELHKTRQTGSLPKDDLLGRGKDKESVIKWLRKSSNEEHQSHVTSTTWYNNISLLSIVGHGGMGKTTLLQHVYQDEIMKEFDLKMWVCVSDSFDVKKVIADMLESTNLNRPSLESLNTLQESLKSKVMSKKFLLVLDDLWDKEEEFVLLSKWGDVLAPLAYGGLGSKILITTRTKSVASMIAKVFKKKIETLTVKGLEEDECLQLLNNHAFADVENLVDYRKLRSLTGELVKKLYGSPLAAKIMGGVLNSSLDERHWRHVLNNSLGFNGIIPILKLSYIFLPVHLQRCFSFCSIFAQDHLFDKEDLIRMWIALDFIQPSHNNQGESLTLEDIGKRYFDVLIKKSFLDEAIFPTKSYKMHDLLHELAQSVSTQECFRFAGDENLLLGVPQTIRHLSVETRNPEVLKNMGRFKNLRTLLIASYNQSFVDALNEMFKVTRSIRLLCMSNKNDNIELRVIPENIGYLHHLRYLRFSVYKGKLLPRSLSSLYHLQFIIFDINPSTYPVNDYFPSDMNNLSNLRYLKSDNVDFPGIGNLKFLQEIREFRIKNKNGYRIEELEHMNELRILEIKNIINVRDAEEACNAKLCEKRKLTHLYLYWGEDYLAPVGRHSGYSDLDERVLDNLQPHNYLKTLLIIYYMGARSPIWINEAHLINNLQEIYLFYCSEWEILPPFGQLPFLKTLELRNMPKAKRLENKFHGNDACCVFPSLQYLCFENMEALVDWFDASAVDGLFPCLTQLFLYNCPNLQELPYLPPKLQSLNIDNIGWKTLNCCNISKSIPLKTLEVYHCLNISSISLVGVIGKLEKLTIINFPDLISLGGEHQEADATENCQLILDHLTISDPSVLQMEPLRSSTSIRSLTIKDNEELVLFSVETEQWLLQVSSSLRELQFINLQSLQSLPSSLTSISSLEILYIVSLPRLRELPKLASSLKVIRI